jgi:hypothetical protein
MPYVEATDRPVFWAVGDPIVATGIMEEAGVTVTGLTLFSGEDENNFLADTVGHGTGYDPLPDSGWLEAGKMYSYGDDIVIVRQSHNRTIYPPTETPALFIFYQEGTGILDWIVGEQVYVGTHRMYDSVEYVCLQEHVTQTDWTPPAVIDVLWQLYVEPSQEWQVGVYYEIGTRVTYLDIWYTCRQSHTSQAGWEPPNVLALWLPD